MAKNNDMEKWVRNKDRRKVIRSILQGAVLLLLLILLIRALFTFNTYEPYDEENIELATEDEDTGFIALSYFGVDRNETKTLISTDRLDEHLKALYDSGYVTITQQDIIDYYTEGKALPKKSLYLMFEDGRRDTAIFAQKVTEQYNFLSTIMTYANKFESKDSKFLMPDDLLDLEDSSFWELGTNGYRLEYINVYDRYGNFLGDLDTLEYAHVQPYLGRDYNHYLMDYIRDEYGIPTESTDKMTARINSDYESMRKIYTEELGEMPKTYVLMHANTGQFGENDNVSKVNEENLTDLFVMNFNREGFSLNQQNSSIYDLTRMQPQAYWHTNHLLMRIYDDTNQEMAWAEGDLSRKAHWEEINGKAEFNQDEIYLTCESESTGTLRLKDSEDYEDVIVDVILTGNKLGIQTVYLRADENLDQYLAVSVENNVLIVKNGTGKVFYEENLDEITEKEKISLDEDELAALIAEKEIEVQYADDVASGKDAAVELSNLKDEDPESVEDGAEEYVADINLNDPGERTLHIELKGNQLSVTVDEDYEAFSDLEISAPESGYCYIQSGWGGEAYSQRNLTDDVYDGVFEKLIITENTGANEEVVLYDNTLHGWELFKYRVATFWHNLLNWFISTF